MTALPVIHPIRLKGMTWSHPRGYEPVVACSALYERDMGVSIHWDRRSLQDFESFSIHALAEAYDLIVIDHPHVGQAARARCLVPLDIPRLESERAAIEAGSVGPSYASYTWDRRQWALPIDAAAPVLAYRPDLMATPPATWDAVLDMALAGDILMPLRPPHSVLAFMTMAAHLGTPCSLDGPALMERQDGEAVFDLLSRVSARLDRDAFALDPIDVLERMAAPDSRVAVAPLLYGYVSYARDGFRHHRLAFSNMPVMAPGRPPHGSALGGTGIAVSALSVHQTAAIDFAYWLSSAEVQRGPYARHGGQPAHATAWSDAAINQLSHGFYRDTRATLDGAFVRPRHDGYMAFQHHASERINRALLNKETGPALIEDLNQMFAESLAGQ